MLIYVGYGSMNPGQEYVGTGFVSYGPGAVESETAGGVDEDTQVMTTREGMTDPAWFGFVGDKK